jgi:hypothetical protein
MANTPTIKELAPRLWTARSMDDVSAIEAMAVQVYGEIERRPVGGRENNIGTIRAASDPGLASVERITNAMDAVLELEALQHRGGTTSPRAAAKEWLGLGSEGIAGMTQEERRRLAERLSVILDDSGEPRRPTFIVEDRGIGQHPDDFARTLLSLNESNKVNKPYTMGTYGQGGSAALGFAKATIIISRRHPAGLSGKPDRVGWSIVREMDDPQRMRLPNYSFYAPMGAAGVFELDPALLPDLPHGTKIIHVAYDLQSWATTYTTGIWQLYNAALFDPVMPFIVGGRGTYSPEKRKADATSTRVIIGNAARLGSIERARGDIELAHSDSHVLDLDDVYGSVRITYWVLARPEGTDPRKDVTGSYTRAGSAICMTLYGQRQDQLPRSWIKENAKLPFLYKQIIVQIDADQLTPIAKRELFASTRERATESDLRRSIYDYLAAALRDDEEVRRLNHQAKDRLMQRSTAATNDKIRQRLAKFIKTRLSAGSGSGSAPGSSKKGSAVQSKRPSTPAGVSGQKRNTDDSHLPHVPTHIKFEKEHVRLVQGARTSFWVELDAKNDFLEQHKDALEIIWPAGGEGNIAVKSKSRLMGGKSRWYLACEPDTSLGEYKLRAEFMTPNGLLEDSLVVRVVEPPKPQEQSDGSGEGEPDIDVRWVNKEDWEEHSFTAKSVGRVLADDDGTVIWVNRGYYLLEKALSSSQLTPEQVTVRSERYQFPVACALWLQDHDIQKLPEEKRPTESFRLSEHERVAEAVLAAMNADVDVATDDEM